MDGATVQQHRRMAEHKICLLGVGGVGKTTISAQFALGEFIETYDPTGDDTHRKMVTIDGYRHVLEVLDTAGTDAYVAMLDQYIRTADCFLIMYSISSRYAFQGVRRFHEKVRELKGPGVPVLLIGNKCDLEEMLRDVSTEEGQELAKDFGCEFLETSAKVGTNVEEAFLRVVRIKLEMDKPKPEPVPEPVLVKKGWRKRWSRLSVSLKRIRKESQIQ